MSESGGEEFLGEAIAELVEVLRSEDDDGGMHWDDQKRLIRAIRPLVGAMRRADAPLHRALGITAEAAAAGLEPLWTRALRSPGADRWSVTYGIGSCSAQMYYALTLGREGEAPYAEREAAAERARGTGAEPGLPH